MGLALQIVILMTFSVTVCRALKPDEINPCEPLQHGTFSDPRRSTVSCCGALKPDEINPCDPSQHGILSDPRRSTGYDLRASDTPLTDSNMGKQYYRFVGLNGKAVEMPNKCPGSNVCGTNVAIWANCTFPTAKGEKVACPTCARMKEGDNCCGFHDRIYIYLCDGFFVYDLSLKKSPFDLAFCAGTSKRCPVGQRSATGFEPCSDSAVTLTKPPKLTISNITLEHTWTFVSPSTEATSTFRVTWTFNGAPDPNIPAVVLTGSQRSATLTVEQLKRHYNSEIICQVESYAAGFIETKKTYQSPSTFFGVKISPEQLEMTASGGEQEITITSNTPLNCPGSGPCCVNFKVTLDKPGVVTLKNYCNYKLCSTDWNEAIEESSVTIGVSPTVTPIASGIANVRLSIGDMQATGTGSILEIYKGFFQAVVIPITVQRQKSYTCYMTGDPHITSFDKAPILDHYQVGDYTAVYIEDREFTVQIRTLQCWAGTCICGIAVKERSDVIRIIACGKTDFSFATVETPYQLSSGVTVQRSSDGRSIGILLSSGSELKIELAENYINLNIQLPAFDRAKTVGLCGTNDGNKANDFKYPSGKIAPACKKSCFNDDFVESWRVSGAASMFQVVPPQPDVAEVVEFCACTGSTNGISKSNSTCTPRGDTPDIGIACPGCLDITANLGPPPGGPKIFQEQPKIPPVNPNQVWPTVKGITETNGNSMCTAALQKSPLYNRCKDVTEIVQIVTGECLSDLLFGGLPKPSESITQSFTSKCVSISAEDPKNYLPSQNGKTVLIPELTTKLCSVECDSHGKCQDGKCVCQPGWTGESCQINVNLGPQIHYVPGKIGCISDCRPCDAATFDKSNVDIFATVTCRIQRVNARGEIVGSPRMESARGAVSSSAICALPPTRTLDDTFIVSISTDDVKYGNQLSVIPVPDSCLDCSKGSCTKKSKVCHINDFCFNHAEVNPNNPGEMCDIWKNTTAWSGNEDEQC